MIKVAIAEPNREYVKRLKRLLKKFFLSLDLAVKIDYISEISYKKINTNYNVLFLDTDLPDCLETARKLKNLNGNIKIVFVSDGKFNDNKNIEFALTGYDIGISGYILKTYAENEVINMFSYVFRLPLLNLN